MVTMWIFVPSMEETKFGGGNEIRWRKRTWWRKQKKIGGGNQTKFSDVLHTNNGGGRFFRRKITTHAFSGVL